MKCPYCQQDMQEGYIGIGKQDICWTPKGKKQSWIVNRAKPYQKMLAKMSWIHGSSIKVYRCPDCCIEVINENDL